MTVDFLLTAGLLLSYGAAFITVPLAITAGLYRLGVLRGRR